MMRLLTFLISLCIFYSCSEEVSKKATPKVDDIDVEVKVVRFDQEIRSFNKDKIGSSYVGLLTKYPRMTDLYFKRLIPLYDSNQDTFYSRIAAFIEDDRIRKLADTVSQLYPSLETIDKELTSACKYLKYYFPERPLPKFYTVFTEFGYPTFIFEDEKEDAVGIGLDMFLGESFEYQKINPHDPVFSQYLTRTYNKEHLTKKSVEIIVTDILGDPPGKRFIDLMLHHGKRLYLLEALLPTAHDTILFEYTESQMDWVKGNEMQMWNFFLDKNMMYETNQLKLTKFLDPAPTTKGMPKESPGRAATYIGYKIIESFMNRNPTEDLKSLVSFKDSQALLEKSKYKPKRK